MKFSTANIKDPSYDENHVLYVGTHTGSFKQINIVKGSTTNDCQQINLQSIDSLTKTSKITCLEWGDNEMEILVGRENKHVKIFDPVTSESLCQFEVKDGPVVGLARYDSVLISASASGTLQYVKDSPTAEILVVGDNLSKMKQCQEEKKLVVTGGKTSKNMIKVWDLSTKQNIFTGKNVRKDHLELEIPTWESGLSFLDRNCLASCSRYGYVRGYDMRAQRRPIFNYMNEAEQIAFTCLAHHDQLLFVGSNLGTMCAYDRRNPKKHVHTYKGFVGSITDVGCDITGKYLYTSSLDRYVRIHNADSTKLLYQSYVKSKATQILFKDMGNIAVDTEDDDDCELVENTETEQSTSGAVKDAEYESLFDNMTTITDAAPPKAKKRKQK